MEGRVGKSHRPDSINSLMARVIVWTGFLWMVLDTSFTISRAFDSFRVPNFFVRLALAICMGVACAASQKAVFEIFINREKREQFRSWWETGIAGKVFVLLLSIVVFGFIHFSWMATSKSIGIAKGTFAIPNFGVKDIAFLTTYLSGILAGIVGAFMDEALFLAAQILKD